MSRSWPGRLGAMLSTALVLSGCLGVRPPAPPGAQVVAPLQWREPNAQASRLRDGWWREFGDPVLSALVERAIVNIPQVGEAAARVQEARAQERLAHAQRGPDIGFSNIGGKARDLAVTGPITTYGDLPQATISWDFDLFHRLADADAAARANLLSSQASQDAVRLSTAASVAQAYITLLGYDERLRVVQETVTTRAASLHIAQRRWSVGYSSRLELEEARSSYQAAAELVPQSRLAVSQQENALSILLGDMPRHIERNPRGLAGLRVPLVPGDLPANLLRRRPDVYASALQLESLEHSLDAARAARLPDLSLTGMLEGVFASALPQPNYQYNIAGELTAPIFDSGRRKAAEEASIAQRNQAAFAFRSTALVAFREVNDSLYGVTRRAEIILFLSREASADFQTVHIAQRRYVQGYSPYLEQLVAERQLLSSRLSLIQSQAEQLDGFVILFEALGGGWNTPSNAALNRVSCLACISSHPAKLQLLFGHDA